MEENSNSGQCVTLHSVKYISQPPVPTSQIVHCFFITKLSWLMLLNSINDFDCKNSTKCINIL